MSRFWRIWLTVWCWALGLYGVILAGAHYGGWADVDRVLFDFLNGSRQLATDTRLRHLSVIGGVTICWSLTVYAASLVAHHLGKPRQPIWGVITASAVTLYVIVSGLSIVTGFALSLVPNTIFLGGLVLPVIWNGALMRKR